MEYNSTYTSVSYSCGLLPLTVFANLKVRFQSKISLARWKRAIAAAINNISRMNRISIDAGIIAEKLELTTHIINLPCHS